MKKILSLLTAVLLMATLSFAQTKKDGTPDKRFKGNMTVKPKPIPTTKAGTPDMRYKMNKKPKQ
jgi:uncharacterized protein YxeA